MTINEDNKNTGINLPSVKQDTKQFLDSGFQSDHGKGRILICFIS